MEPKVIFQKPCWFVLQNSLEHIALISILQKFERKTSRYDHKLLLPYYHNVILAPRRTLPYCHKDDDEKTYHQSNINEAFMLTAMLRTNLMTKFVINRISMKLLFIM